LPSGATDLSPIGSNILMNGLNLTDSQATDYAVLSRLAQLRNLRLTGSKIKDLTPLLGLQLAELNIVGTPVQDITPLARVKSLKQLTVSASIPKAQVDAVKKANPGLVVTQL
jgi:Leucine-rich repeat (LRR) protein